MATRYIRYPTITAGGGGGSEQALSPNGGPLPSEIKVVGGYDGSVVRVLKTDSSGSLVISGTVSGGSSIGVDMFDTAVVTTRYNQLEISFDAAPSSSLITNTSSGGGSVTNANGHELYSTGTAVTAQAKGVSTQTISYRPGAEVYAYFTAAFTAPTSVNSYQRIGLYDANNGFFIGYEGTTFGITRRSGGSDTFTARGSWNGDPLNGASTSAFTRNGTPEAINFTYSNVYRIRFGWLGSASIIFEVLSPDEQWVVFNTIRMPNSQLNPSIQNPDLPITIDVKKTSADATNLVMATGCWAAGASSDTQPITTTLTDNSLATLTRAVITGYSSAGGGSYNNVKVTPSGSLTVAVGDITGIVGQQTMANSIPVVIASNQSAVSTSASQSGTWNINNISGTISLPTGAATSAKQPALGIAGTASSDVLTVQGIAGMVPLIVDGSGSTQPVSGTVAATQSGTWNINNVSGTISLPTGAATESTLSALNTKVPSGLTVSSTRLLVDGSGVTQPISGSVSVSNFPATQPVSGTVAATQSGNWSSRTLDASGNSITSSFYPILSARGLDVNVLNTWIATRIYDSVGNSINTTSGALNVAQSGNWAVRNQDAVGNGITSTVVSTSRGFDVNVINTSLTVAGTVTANQGGTWSTRTQDGSGNAITSTTNALDINIKSSNITFGGPGGRTSILLYRNVYSTTNVTTAAYTQVVASLASNVNIIDIFDSSGQTMVIATGAAGAEVQKAYIYPGGPGQIPLAIAAGTRVAIRAVSANATLGEINMTFYT